jgi:hypothetical protein
MNKYNIVSIFLGLILVTFQFQYNSGMIFTCMQPTLLLLWRHMLNACVATQMQLKVKGTIHEKTIDNE